MYIYKISNPINITFTILIMKIRYFIKINIEIYRKVRVDTAKLSTQLITHNSNQIDLCNQCRHISSIFLNIFQYMKKVQVKISKFRNINVNKMDDDFFLTKISIKLDLKILILTYFKID